MLACPPHDSSVSVSYSLSDDYSSYGAASDPDSWVELCVTRHTTMYYAHKRRTCSDTTRQSKGRLPMHESRHAIERHHPTIRALRIYLALAEHHCGAHR